MRSQHLTEGKKDSTYSRLEEIHELNNVWMMQSLEHFELIFHHLLISFDILLEYYFDCNFLAINFRFSNYPVGACA